MHGRTRLAAATAAAALLLPAGVAGADHHEEAMPVHQPAKAAAAAKPDAAQPDEPRFGMDTADTYVVEAGDTLSQIAQDHLGSKQLWRHIAEANGIDDPKRLRVGQKLQIPKRQAEWLEEASP